MGSGGLKKPCIRWGADTPCEGAILRGEGMPDDTLPWALQKRLNRSICRLDCGLGWLKEPRMRWGPDPPCEWTIFWGKNMPGHARRHSAANCANRLRDRDAVWVVDSGRPKEALCYMGVHTGATWRIWLNSPFRPGRMKRRQCGLMSNDFDHLFCNLISIVILSCSIIIVTSYHKFHYTVHTLPHAYNINFLFYVHLFCIRM